MKIELDQGVESAIRATLPPTDNRKPLFFNGRLDLMIEELGISTPKSEYSRGMLEALGYKTIDSMLTERLIKSDTSLASPQAPKEQHRYHPKDIEIVNDYVNEAREGVSKVIDELSISKNAKRYIRGALDTVELNIDLAGANGTETLKDEEGRIHINLNIPDIFSVAYFISQHFVGEHISSALFKGLTYNYTAHEFGHAIHHALSRLRHNAPHAWHDKALFIGYPMTMTCDDKIQQTIAKGLYRSISNERFAQFFEWEVLRGFGLSTNIRDDLIRTDALSIFGNGFTFSQMDHFIDGCQQRIYEPKELKLLSPEEREFRLDLEKHLIDAFIIYSVSSYYTYPRHTIEMLIAKGWRGKQRELQQFNSVVV